MKQRGNIMKKNNESKIFTILYVIIAFLVLNTILNIVIVSKMDTQKLDGNTTSANNTNTASSDYDVSMFTTLKSPEVVQKIKSGDRFLLYIGKSTCSFCKQMLPNLQQAQNEYKYQTVYLDISQESLTSEDYQELSSLLNIEMEFDGDKLPFGDIHVTPMMAILDKGKMVAGMIGYNSYSNFTAFLQQNGFSK